MRLRSSFNLRLITLVSLFLPFLMTKAHAGWDVGDGGDHIKIIFEKGRNDAVTMLRSFDLAAPQVLVDERILTFLKRPVGNSTLRDAMIGDVGSTPYLWIPGDGSDNTPVQQLCAQTNLPGFGNTIRFSLAACESHLQLASEAEFAAVLLILHEAAHHFDLDDSPENDAFASQIALTVLADWKERLAHQDPTSGDVQVNPKAFNAFNIWLDGEGTEILDYPEWYGLYESLDEKPIASDGVFTVLDEEFWASLYSGIFIAVPTEGAKVKANALIYPSRNGKQLTLKFLPPTRKEMDHRAAVEYCKGKNMRLPTARELFDYCTIGVSGPNYGPSFVRGAYPSTGRCSAWVWSASLSHRDGSSAWHFAGYLGTLSAKQRDKALAVGCVGGL